MLRALRKIAASMAPMEILRPLLLSFLVVAIFWGRGRSPTAPEAMAGTVFATWFGLGLASHWLRGALPCSSAPESDNPKSSPEWTRLGLTLLAMSAFSLLLSQTDILMIGVLGDTTQAGIYSVGVRLSGLLQFGLLAANSIAAPLI